MHAWFSEKHGSEIGYAIYQRADSSEVKLTFTHEDKTLGEQQVNEQFSRFNDYVYVGEVAQIKMFYFPIFNAAFVSSLGKGKGLSGSPKGSGE